MSGTIFGEIKTFGDLNNINVIFMISTGFRILKTSSSSQRDDLFKSYHLVIKSENKYVAGR